jgi:hypothetical protein
MMDLWSWKPVDSIESLFNEGGRSSIVTGVESTYSAIEGAQE